MTGRHHIDTDVDRAAELLRDRLRYAVTDTPAFRIYGPGEVLVFEENGATFEVEIVIREASP